MKIHKVYYNLMKQSTINRYNRNIEIITKEWGLKVDDYDGMLKEFRKNKISDASKKLFISAILDNLKDKRTYDYECLGKYKSYMTRLGKRTTVG